MVIGDPSPCWRVSYARPKNIRPYAVAIDPSSTLQLGMEYIHEIKLAFFMSENSFVRRDMQLAVTFNYLQIMSERIC